MRAIAVRLGILSGILAVIVITGTIGFSIVEHLSIADAFYFTIVTIATVGYGDITPTTEAGRVLSIILIIFGVGAFTGAIVDSTGYMMETRQNKVRRERTNILVGLFMSEIGTPLLELLHCTDPGLHEIQAQAQLGQNLTEADFLSLKEKLSHHKFTLEPESVRLKPMRELLERKTNILLRLLENPMLLEREESTETLRATGHLREELAARPRFENLPSSNVAHLALDASRAYGHIARGWVEHMRYLRGSYPYLFSLALRNNPFDENRCAIVR